MAVPEEGFLSPNYDSNGDEMGSSTCEHMLESKDENGKEPEKNNEEHDQSKPPSDELDIKKELPTTLTR